MNETLEITTEQINDVPLLLGLVEEMGIRQAIDGRFAPTVTGKGSAWARW